MKLFSTIILLIAFTACGYMPGGSYSTPGGNGWLLAHPKFNVRH